MVYPNDFLHMAPMLDDNVAKLMNVNAEQQIENYLASASTSPIQDFLISPSSYQPQQEQQNQRQLQLQFPATTVISHSAPNSPPYAIVKTEDVQSQNDYHLMFPSTFDISSSAAQEQQILPSQRPSYVSLMQQRQQHQQQQQQHAQQLRMQHQQLQQQIMYDSPSHSAVTSSMMSSMVSAATSSSLYVPTAITTSAPFFSTIAQDDVPSLPFQRRPTYPAAHPAAPKRKLEEPVSPQLTAESDVPTSPSTSPMTQSRISTNSRFEKVKNTRSTKVVKSSSPSSSPISFPLTDASDSKARANGKKAMAIKKAISESRDSSEQPENSLDANFRAGAGNVTHPRRAAQNRAAQRTFRNRRKAYIKELEQKVGDIDRTREFMEAVQAENQEVWRRLQVLESLAARNGLSVPVFPPLASLAATATLSGVDGTSVSVVTGNEYGLDNNDMMMMNQYGSSDDE